MNNDDKTPDSVQQAGLAGVAGSASFWRERVYVQDVRQEAGEIWLRVSAANAPRGTPPMACFCAGQILVIEIHHDPQGVHGPNAQAHPTAAGE